MAAKRKLADQQLKTIRRRFNKGEYLGALALAYGVNRKTLRRRLDALAQAEVERAQRIVAKRLGRQTAAEGQKLTSNPRDRVPCAGRRRAAGRSLAAQQPARTRDPRRDWLERPTNLSGRANASGLVRVGNPDGSVRQSVERSQLDGLLAQGWTLA